MTQAFLAKHNLHPMHYDFGALVASFMSEMDLGLAGEGSSLRMIPTYINAENEFLIDAPALAIDAGGTNFRAALITFTEAGGVIIEGRENYAMPGINQEISSQAFFDTIAQYVRDKASKTNVIGFCFSYPTEILPNRDGRLIQFCKEVQAPEVVGQQVGKRLLEALGTPQKNVVLLNDTVSTLLAGKSANRTKQYSSYIGFICGTGTNICYIEQPKNIKKIAGLLLPQVINVESGNFDKMPRTTLDIQFDATTKDSGSYTFEKMVSGAYLGGLCLLVLKQAAEEGLFSAESTRKLRELSSLSTGEMNDFVTGETPTPLILLKEEEIPVAQGIATALIARAALLAASKVAAVIMKTGKGRTPENSILITIEGTAFYKLHEFSKQFEEYLAQYFQKNKRYYEFSNVDDSSMLGAALAALIP